MPAWHIKLFRLIVSLVAGFIIAGFFVIYPVSAAQQISETKNKGLTVSPLRNYLSLDSGSSKNSYISVSNLTPNAITVGLSVKQFSVADYNYDFSFEDTKKDWITLSEPSVDLDPYKSKEISYKLLVPPAASPGGQYFTILATTYFDNEGVRTQVQAATLLYITVNGDLIKTSKFQSGRIDPVQFGAKFNFGQDIQNTGNTHYFVYVAGEINGMFINKKGPDVAHILLPGSIRSLSNYIPAPVLPGVYKATFGYKTEDGKENTLSKYIVYLPPWFCILIVLATLLGIKRFRHNRVKKTKTKSIAQDSPIGS